GQVEIDGHGPEGAEGAEDKQDTKTHEPSTDGDMPRKTTGTSAATHCMTQASRVPIRGGSGPATRPGNNRATRTHKAHYEIAQRQRTNTHEPARKTEQAITPQYLHTKLFVKRRVMRYSLHPSPTTVQTDSHCPPCAAPKSKPNRPASPSWRRPSCC